MVNIQQSVNHIWERKMAGRFLAVIILMTIIGTFNLPAYCQQISPENSPGAVASPTPPAAPSPKTSPSPAESVITPQMITAIGGLWPILLMAFLIILVVVTRKPLRTFLDNIVSKSEKATDVELKAGPAGLTLKGVAKEVAKEVVEEVVTETRKKEELRGEEAAMSAKKDDDVSEKVTIREPKTSGEFASDLFNSIFAKKNDEFEEIYKRMQELETNAVERLRNEGMYLYGRFRFGDTSAISRLEELANKEEVSADSHAWLGACFEVANDLQRAADAYMKAAQKQSDINIKANNIVGSAKCLFKLGKENVAYELIKNELLNTNDNTALFILYNNLASLYEKAKEYELQALALEKAVEYSPNDTHALFDAALTVSKLGLSGLALFHYRSILDFKPEHSGAMNNIGVEYDSLGLPIYSVNAYKKSSELNETLASANLAYRLINAGFAEEADEILNKAKQLPDVHANVGSAISTLSQNREAEGEKREEILASAVKQQQFLREYAQAYFSPKGRYDFSGTWLFTSGIEAVLVQTGDQVELNWNVGGHKYQLVGVANNNSAKVTYNKMKYAYLTPTNELGFGKESEGYAFVTDDGQKLSIMLPKGSETTFMNLVRKPLEVVQTDAETIEG